MTVSAQRVGPDTFHVIGQALSSLGVPVPGAGVSVTDVLAGGAATIYSDEFLRSSVSQPYYADLSGRFEFYVGRGKYSFAYSGSDRFTASEQLIIGGPSPAGLTKAAADAAYAPVATPGAVARYISGAWVAPAAAHPWLWLVGVSDPTPQASDGLGGGDEILYVARPDVADMMKLPMVGQDPSCSLTVAQGLAQPSSGDLALMYWSPYKSESYTKVRFGVGSTASSGLTIGLLGIWTSNDAGDLLALVASSANNMSMFASASQLFDVPLQASFTPTLGQRYALGVLQSGTTVGRLTAITYQGGVIGGTPAIVDSDTRRINGKIAGRSSLPSSADHSSLVTFNYQIWFRLLP